jgi:hypothetical protein
MSLSDYSDLEKEIAEAPDAKVLPKGSEVKVRIIAVRTGVSNKNEARWYQPVFDVPADPMVTEFNDFIWDLADGRKLDEKQRVRNMNRFKNFAASVGLDYSKPFDWEQLVGMEGWVITGYKDDPEYGPKNTVSKYVIGQGEKRVAVGGDDDIPF